MTTDPPAFNRTEWARSSRGHTRPDRAAEQLADMAMSCHPGERLGTKEELRVLCGVSVGTFNEALRMVQTRGLVTVRSGPGGGLFASQQSAMVRLGNSMLALGDEAASVVDAFRLRHALDQLLIEDALEHASAHDVGVLRSALDLMKVAIDEGDAVAFMRAHWTLHARLAEISPSGMLRSFYLNLLEITETHLLTAIADDSRGDDENLGDYFQRRFRLHVALVDAIAGHDWRALELMQQHNAEGPMVGQPLPVDGCW